MHKFYKSIAILFFTSTLFSNASTSNTINSELVNMVKEQQYLAKKISNDYVAFEADQDNPKKKEKMQNSIQHFNQNHLKLIEYKNNTKLIDEKLSKVDKIWQIAHKLSQTKKHSVMIVTTMDDISIKMQELRTLYSKMSK
ncbi:MAG: Unknown protein [uncultured Sulfurovum sp.]|uniref:Uncharacterized protein n=1 Tax=uncultured Sulfurovum sp. TaxID=269237 RepID=A0A6S6U551_9BACT|nr:MAG: Unknown protein [uncultured Sulfurovum sp.]